MLVRVIVKVIAEPVAVDEPRVGVEGGHQPGYTSLHEGPRGVGAEQEALLFEPAPLAPVGIDDGP